MEGQGNDVLCNDWLIRSLADDHLTASSSRSDPIVLTSPLRGRLNTFDIILKNGTTLSGGWSPATDNQNHYIQAVFDHMTKVNQILTQGRYHGNGHVTMYKVEYTDDGKTWRVLTDAVGAEKIFPGNTDSDTIQTNTLDCPVFAKGIRIIPLDWVTHVALWFDVTGCYVDNAVTATPTTKKATSMPTTHLALMTNPFMFVPGIMYPFGTTKAPLTTTAFAFFPGISDPFGTGQIIG